MHPIFYTKKVNCFKMPMNWNRNQEYSSNISLQWCLWNTSGYFPPVSSTSLCANNQILVCYFHCLYSAEDLIKLKLSEGYHTLSAPQGQTRTLFRRWRKCRWKKKKKKGASILLETNLKYLVFLILAIAIRVNSHIKHGTSSICQKSQSIFLHILQTSSDQLRVD